MSENDQDAIMNEKDKEEAHIEPDSLAEDLKGDQGNKIEIRGKDKISMLINFSGKPFKQWEEVRKRAAKALIAITSSVMLGEEELKIVDIENSSLDPFFTGVEIVKLADHHYEQIIKASSQAITKANYGCGDIFVHVQGPIADLNYLVVKKLESADGYIPIISIFGDNGFVQFRAYGDKSTNLTLMIEKVSKAAVEIFKAGREEGKGAKYTEPNTESELSVIERIK